MTSGPSCRCGGVRSGLTKWVRLDREPMTIGTLTLDATGAVTGRSGILLPYDR